VSGGSEFLKQAKGELLLPNILKPVLSLVENRVKLLCTLALKKIAYYTTAAASTGLQLGA